MDDPAQNDLWQIRLLGTLEARRGDVVLSRFATSRVAALLARLALFPQRMHSREELAGALWPDADADAGRLSLRVALASLRRQIEPSPVPPGSVLLADRTAVRLNPAAFACDAARFEAALRTAARAPLSAEKHAALHDALALYEGELLPGFYDEWILDERERLQALAEEARRQCHGLPPPTLPPAGRGPAVHSAARALRGFPGQFTRFFGREAEKMRLAALLKDPEVRLVTLLGPGGAGKTRLALETARSVAGSFDGPVCFAALADIGDSSLVIAAVASALRLTLSGDAAPESQVAAALSAGHSLLVLDNMEHLGAGGADEARALLAAVPSLTCLATSRQTLGIAGEHEFPLAPLPVPGLMEEVLIEEVLTDCASVKLFVDRAQAVRPGFAVTPSNAEAVAAVCRSLEGLPLALELAAARIQALSPAQMSAQLEARLDFLTSRRRDLPPRHRSLRAALEWSVQLLSPAQAHFFGGLSVFRGGWTLEAAAAVCDAADPLPLLEQLCERSLIVSEEAGLGVRFRVLESLREFGEEQLSDRERRALACRHAAFFQELAAQQGALWYTPRQNEGLGALSADYDNLRAALSFCRAETLERGGEDWDAADTGLRLAAALGDYWTTRGLMREGMDWLNGALALGGSPAVRADALAQAGWLAAGVSDFAAAQQSLTEAVALCRDMGDGGRLTQALRLRGTAQMWMGDFVPAGADLEESLALGRAQGDERAQGMTLNALGVLANERSGDNIRAKAFYEESLPLLLKVGDRQRAAYCLHNLGNIANTEGDRTRAIALIQHSLALADELGDEWHRAYCLRSLGGVYRDRGDLPEAARLLEEGVILCRRLGDKMTEAGTVLVLADVRRMQGNYTEATALACAALRVSREITHDIGQTEGWINLSETAAAQAQWENAAAFLSAADALRTVPPQGYDLDYWDALLADAHAALDPTLFDAAWHRGRTLTCDDYGLR